MADNIFGLTDTGKTRTNNEDIFIAQPVMGKQYLLGCVIDGVGGYNGGEVAAEIAHDEILGTLDNKQDDIIPAMITAFKRANKAIIARKQQDSANDNMACVSTMVLADVTHNLFYYAHVGDTRLYLLRDGSLVKITHDHSFVGFLEDSGRLTETEAMKHPKRNEINKALGFDDLIETDESYIETGHSPFLPGDMLLLCSDGLTDMVDKTEITYIITQTASLQQKTRQLVDAANTNGGADNITVVLLQNDKAPQVANATKPASAAKTVDVILTPPPPVIAPVEDKGMKQPLVKKGSSATILLTVLCLIFLASTVYLYFNHPLNVDTIAKPVDSTISTVKNPQEIKLQALIDSTKSDTLVLADTAFKSPIVLTDTLHIKRDTLYIQAKGLVIASDSLYKGPAFALSSKSKVLLLDSLQFKDFNTVVHLNGNALVLKKVQFVNCPAPVQNVYALPNNKSISAKLPPAPKVDTVIKILGPTHAGN